MYRVLVAATLNLQTPLESLITLGHPRSLKVPQEIYDAYKKGTATERKALEKMLADCGNDKDAVE